MKILVTWTWAIATARLPRRALDSAQEDMAYFSKFYVYMAWSFRHEHYSLLDVVRVRIPLKAVRGCRPHVRVDDLHLLIEWGGWPLGARRGCGAQRGCCVSSTVGARGACTDSAASMRSPQLSSFSAAAAQHARRGDEYEVDVAHLRFSPPRSPRPSARAAPSPQFSQNPLRPARAPSAALPCPSK